MNSFTPLSIALFWWECCQSSSIPGPPSDSWVVLGVCTIDIQYIHIDIYVYGLHIVLAVPRTPFLDRVWSLFWGSVEHTLLTLGLWLWVLLPLLLAFTILVLNKSYLNIFLSLVKGQDFCDWRNESKINHDITFLTFSVKLQSLKQQYATISHF